MPLRYRDGAPLYGKTLQTVLAKRPCRVIVAANPGEAGATASPRRTARRLRMSPTPPPDEVYRGVTRVFAVVIIGFGIAIIVVTLANGGGAALVRDLARARVHRPRRSAGSTSSLRGERRVIDPFEPAASARR